jgi:uncharacterized repeat protein (TIGR03803 family)
MEEDGSMGKLSLWRTISLVCVFCVLAVNASPAETFRTLVSFDRADGSNPAAALVQAINGSLYGTTGTGGAYGAGTIFEITPGGKFSTLYNFCHTYTGCYHGDGPTGLVQATNGNLYGTTGGGGVYGAGTVFEITPGGKLTTLYSFCSQRRCTDGSQPLAGLVQATNGNFYGTTYYGGTNGDYGTVYSLSVGLRPFVETLPAAGKVGGHVIILGNHLTGTTSVTFNGTAAKFKVVSSTEIMTTVPSGATTGPVKVTTPSCTLISNVNFRVG